jgi:hypothetical protein
VNERLQIHALYVLCVLAAAILVLMWFTLDAMASSASASGGKVEGIDAGMFTGLTLMFREVLGRIQGIWEHGERMSGQKRLADSSPQHHEGGDMTVEADSVEVSERSTPRKGRAAVASAGSGKP